MKSWNTHAWYVTGILATLLIGSVAVNWNGIKDLPSIISFALGLASLLLALIAIVQALTSSGNAEASLGAVREAAEGISATASSIADATSHLREVSASMLRSSEQGRDELAGLRKQLVQKNVSDTTASAAPLPSGQSMDSVVAPGKFTFGSGPAILAAVLAAETGKPLRFKEVFVGDQTTTYEDGVLAGMQAAGIININRVSRVVTWLTGNAALFRKRACEAKIESSGSLGSYEGRMAQVERYFKDQTSAEPKIS